MRGFMSFGGCIRTSNGAFHTNPRDQARSAKLAMAMSALAKTRKWGHSGRRLLCQARRRRRYLRVSSPQLTQKLIRCPLS